MNKEQVEKRNRERINMQPIIFKLGRLQISHDNPQSHMVVNEHLKVINAYWNYRHLFSIVPGHINIRLKKRMLSIPPYPK